MKHSIYKKISQTASKRLVASLMLALIVVSCASKPDSVPEESKLAEADLFDGLKDEAASVSTSSEDPTEALAPAEETSDSSVASSEGSSDYSADSIVRGGGAGNVAYDYYYVAVGGESIGRLAKAIYNGRGGMKHIYAMNPELKDAKQVAADQKVYFDMRKANPRAEYLTKDMIERYKDLLRNKIQARRSKAEGNSMLSQTTVQKGETLQVVSQRLYGTTRLWTELFLMNQEKIGNFDALKVGTVIDYYPVSDFVGGGAVAKADTGSESVAAPAPQMESVPHMETAAAPAVETPAPAPAPVVAEAQPAEVQTPAAEMPSTVKVTEKPSADTGEPLVKGGIPVDSDGGPARNAEATVAGSTDHEMPAHNGQRIRPAQSDASAGDEEGFFSRNLRRFVYIGFIALIVAGGYYLTRPGRGTKNKFSGIQPMPNPLAGTQPAPRPRVMPSASPNRVTVNRGGPPPHDGGQKTG